MERITGRVWSGVVEVGWRRTNPASNWNQASYFWRTLLLSPSAVVPPYGLRLEAGALAVGWSGWRAAQDGWGEYGGRWNCRGNKGEKGRLSCRSERVITSRLYLTALDTGQSLGACSPRFIRTNQYL
jgi:hypothetical protein